jgi:secreted PhoX family phosphatase
LTRRSEATGEASIGLLSIGLFLIVLLLLGSVSSASAFSSGQAATLVIGQSLLTARDDGVGAAGLGSPAGVAFDSHGDLWVADFSNGRVLEYTPPFTTDEAASLVIGQSSFTTSTATTSATGMYGPVGIAFDSHGDLWVADSGNNRVLEYAAPLTSGEAASLVIGQSSFTAENEATNATGLGYPVGVAFDSSGDLWVADNGNNRVLEYAGPSTSSVSSSTVSSQSSSMMTSLSSTSILSGSIVSSQSTSTISATSPQAASTESGSSSAISWVNLAMVAIDAALILAMCGLAVIRRKDPWR